jgi:hypothetical protein
VQNSEARTCSRHQLGESSEGEVAVHDVHHTAPAAAVDVPSQPRDRQRTLLEELAKELGEDVQPERKSFLEKLRDLFG